MIANYFLFVDYRKNRSKKDHGTGIGNKNRWYLRRWREKFNLFLYFPKWYLVGPLIFFSNSVLVQNFIFFNILVFDLSERKSTIEFQCIKRKSLLSPISTTKIVDLGVHMFYLMKEILWCLFKVLILLKKIDQSQEKKIIMVWFHVFGLFFLVS